MGNPKTRHLSIVHIGLAALGIFALYFAAMGSYPLVDPDEPVYGQIAKEMAAGAGWLTPHFDGQPWFDKPPLFYWLSGLSARVLGPTELACRLPSAVLAVAVLLLVYFLVNHDFSRRAALFAALAMATCLQTIILARAAVTDMTLLFCLLGALYAYRRWFDADGPSRFAWMAACGAMTGLGMLAKGPVAAAAAVRDFLRPPLAMRQGSKAAELGRARGNRGDAGRGLAVVCRDVCAAPRRIRASVHRVSTISRGSSNPSTRRSPAAGIRISSTSRCCLCSSSRGACSCRRV